MTPPDVAFPRLLPATVIVFAVLAAVYFRLLAERRNAIVGRPGTVLLAIVGWVSVSAAVTSDLSPFAKVCVWLVGGLSVPGCCFLLIASRSKGPVSRTQPRT